MKLQVNDNPEIVNEGDIVIFVTGEKKTATYPQYLRVGKVLQGYNNGVKYPNGKGFTVEELVTGKVWYPYSQNTVLIDGKNKVRGIASKVVLTDQI